MHQPRTCPHCGKRVPVSGNRRFDQRYNVLCAFCGKVVFPADLAGSEEVATAIRSKLDKDFSYYKNHRSVNNLPMSDNNLPMTDNIIEAEVDDD